MPAELLWLPALYTVFVWWFGTGVILYLDGLPRWTFPWTMTAATLMLALALGGLAVTADDTRTTAAYLSFTSAVVVWGWQEVAFLLGYVTGSRRTPCPAGSVGWRRAGYALQAVLHHEIALVVLAAAVTAATWEGANQTGFWTFMVLWVMRQSAKLNVFLGVRNLGEAFLPPHLRYLGSYFTQRPMNGLFPVSVVASSLVAAVAWQGAFAESAGHFEATALCLVASLLTLAILEHGFMVLPLRTETLWRWGMRSRERQ